MELTTAQIKAAGRIHAGLAEWGLVDRALDGLAKSMPGFGPEATLVKAVAVNALYGTNVLAIVRVASHLAGLLKQEDLETAGPELVERLAEVPLGGAEKAPKKRRSFASKFAHFFIDPTRFPIFDKYSDRMLRFHLGDRLTGATPVAYVDFARRFDAVSRIVGLSGPPRILDRYLWISGQYRAWLRDRDALINSELRRVFQSDHVDLRVLIT